MSYKFTLKLSYNLKSDNEDDAVSELVDLIKRDWPYYADEGDLVKVKGKRSKIVMRTRDRLNPSPQLATLHREGQTYKATKARIK